MKCGTPERDASDRSTIGVRPYETAALWFSATSRRRGRRMIVPDRDSGGPGTVRVPLEHGNRAEGPATCRAVPHTVRCCPPALSRRMMKATMACPVIGGVSPANRPMPAHSSARACGTAARPPTFHRLRCSPRSPPQQSMSFFSAQIRLRRSSIVLRVGAALLVLLPQAVAETDGARVPEPSRPDTPQRSNKPIPVTSGFKQLGHPRGPRSTNAAKPAAHSLSRNMASHHLRTLEPSLCQCLPDLGKSAVRLLRRHGGQPSGQVMLDDRAHTGHKLFDVGPGQRRHAKDVAADDQTGQMARSEGDSQLGSVTP